MISDAYIDEVVSRLPAGRRVRREPFCQLAMGLAGFSVLQEGLAALAEHLVGGLEMSRLRLLAARVLAVRSLTDDAGFVDTFRLLTRQMGFAKRMAYTITMRVHRGGGITKRRRLPAGFDGHFILSGQPCCVEKIAKIRSGMTVFDLLKEMKK